MTNRWKNQALDARSLLREMTVLTSRLRQEKGSTQLTTLWTSGTWKNRLDVQALHSQTSSELSVWVFTTSLWGRDFCLHLTHKEMWAEIQWLFQELTLAMGSFFYYTRLLFKLFENYLRHRISGNCLVILVNLCFRGFYAQVFGTTGEKQKPRESSRCQGENHPQGPWPIMVNQRLA